MTLQVNISYCIRIEEREGGREGGGREGGREGGGEGGREGGRERDRYIYIYIEREREREVISHQVLSSFSQLDVESIHLLMSIKVRGHSWGQS